MTISNIDVDATIERVKTQLAAEKDLSPALKSSLAVLLLLVTILLSRLGLNSKNSSKPPSADPSRTKEPKNKSDRKPGGQKGHNGTSLQPVSDPDEIEPILIDRRTLPKGRYQDVGYESRQVVDLDISKLFFYTCRSTCSRNLLKLRVRSLKNRKKPVFMVPISTGLSTGYKGILVL